MSSIWDIARQVWNAPDEPEGNSRPMSAADLAAIQRSQQEVAWRQISARIHITQEQMEDVRNNQGAFIQAARDEYRRTAHDWARYMQQASGTYDAFYKKPIDPDLELDEGL